MQCTRLTDPDTLNQGTLAGMRLDYLVGSTSRDGGPALVPDVDTTQPTNHTVQAGQLSGSGWALVTGTPSFGQFSITQEETTSNPGDSWSFTTAAYAIDVAAQFSSIGAICRVYVDGQPQVAFSTQGTPALHRVYLDGQPHTVLLKTLGESVAAAAVVGAVTETSGTAGLASGVTVTRNGQATTTQTWTLKGNTSGSPHYVGVYIGATLQGTINVGASNSTLVPGCTISVAQSTWDGTSVATLQTTAPTLAFDGYVEYLHLVGTATYTSPVLDCGQPNAQWPMLSLDFGPGASPPQVTLAVGPNPAPDGTWTQMALTPVVVPDADGNPWSAAHYAVPQGTRSDDPRGEFAQFVVSTHPATTGNAPRLWAANARVFSWLPESDPFLRRVDPDWFLGPKALNSRSLLTAMACLAAFADREVQDLQDGLAISSARGSYLTRYGQQLNLPRTLGEGDTAYRARLVALSSLSGTGGSLPFLTKVLQGALGSGVVIGTYAKSSVAWDLGQGLLGTDTILGGRAVGYWRWFVQIPIAGLQISPDAAIALVQTFRPVGSIVDISFT